MESSIIIGHESNNAGVLGRGWGGVRKVKDKVVEVGSSIKKLGQDDPRRIIHSIKVGLALTLVSLVYYVRPIYDGYGISGIWAVLTVVVVFEFTVGGTLGRGINRGCATLTAGALAVGAKHLASLFGEEGEPIVLGIQVFLLAAASTFTRFFPKIKARYDYGILIFILTFSMVAVSGYKVDKLLEFAHERLSTIILGGAICMIVSICVCPVWAGTDLHHLIANNIEKLANYLEGFGNAYFQPDDGAELSFNTNTAVFQAYKTVLTSKNTEESWANLARWEPGHGGFGFRHPWKQYLKIGALARKCAYQIEALNTYLINPNLQAPAAFKSEIQEPCVKISSESSNALKAIAASIKQMTDPSFTAFHVENAKAAIEELQFALKTKSFVDLDLSTIVPGATVVSLLVQVVDCIEEISDEACELSRLANFKKTEASSVQILHRGVINPVVADAEGDDGRSMVVEIVVHRDLPPPPNKILMA